MTCTFTLQKTLSSTPIQINNTTIEEKSSVCILGVTYDKHLKFSQHVDKAIEKTRGSVHAITRLKRAGVGTKSLTLFFQSKDPTNSELCSPQLVSIHQQSWQTETWETSKTMSEVNTPRARQLRWKACTPKPQWANRFIRHCLLEIHRENTRQWMSSIVLVYTYHNNWEKPQKTSQANQSHSFAREKLVSQILLAFFLCICL